jgi:outer membrane protein OmpA-like peptidoglycan-associated protein
VAGCVHSPTVAPGVAAGREQAARGKLAESVNRLGSDLAKARQEQVDILSPDRFKASQKAFLSAQKELQTGAGTDAVRQAVTRSRSQLQKAEANAKIASITLADALSARKMARDAGATKFKKEYRAVEDDFLDLSRAIENDDLSEARKNRDAVAKQYRALEIRAIKAKTIGDVRTHVDRAEAADAPDIAPLSYARAVKRLKAADAYISAHPHSRKEMQALAGEARFAANRLKVVADMAKRVKSMTPEAIVLLMEKDLHAISTALDAKDRRDQDFQTQVDGIVASADALKKSRDGLAAGNRKLQARIDALKADYQARIDALNVRMATLEGKSRVDQMARDRMARERKATEQRLTAEKEFNQRYLTVQNDFDVDEADVYRQENQIVIRLKAMRFPVGKSVILPENDALLGKVQKAIRTFDNPRVIVEGHTDATGPDEVNKRLSQKRADAVRDYLIASHTLPSDSISAVGYGADRPLASNATAAGRAINRRIDVIIITQNQPL